MTTKSRKRAKKSNTPLKGNKDKSKPLNTPQKMFTEFTILEGIQIENIHTLLPSHQPPQPPTSNLRPRQITDWLLNTLRNINEGRGGDGYEYISTPDNNNNNQAFDVNSTGRVFTLNMPTNQTFQEELIQALPRTIPQPATETSSIKASYDKHLSRTKKLLAEIYLFKQNRKIETNDVSIKSSTNISSVKIKVRTIDYESGHIEAVLKGELSSESSPLYTLLNIGIIDLENNFFWEDFKLKMNNPSLENIPNKNYWLLFGELNEEFTENLYILSQLFYNEEKYIEYKKKLQQYLFKKQIVFLRSKEVHKISQQLDITIDGCYYMKYDLKERYIIGFYVQKNGNISQMISLNIK